MNSLSLANTLRVNHDEVLRRWHDHLNGHIAEDFEQMLKTPMGQSVGSSLLAATIEFYEAEEYQRIDMLRKIRELARDAAFRRSAVGFGLPDIIHTALALRRALEETMLNHVVTSEKHEERELMEGVLCLNRIGDAIIQGDIAGFFSYHEFHDKEGESREVA